MPSSRDRSARRCSIRRGRGDDAADHRAQRLRRRGSIEDFRKWPVIFATRKDGKAMTVRDKGPIFIIYPFDLDRLLYNEKIFPRSAWRR